MPLGAARAAIIAQPADEGTPFAHDADAIHFQTSGANPWPSFNHTLSADADLILVGVSYMDKSQTTTGHSVTYAGVSMTEVPNSLVHGPSTFMMSAWFYLDKTSAGGNWPGAGTHAVVVDPAGGNNSTGGAVCISYEGASQDAPPAWTDFGTVTGLNTTTACAAGSVLLHAVSVDSEVTLTFGADETALGQQAISSNTLTAGFSRDANAGANDNMEFTHDGPSEEASHSIIEVRAPAGAAQTFGPSAIAHDDDDAETNVAVGNVFASSDLELIMDGTTQQLIGLRFTNVTVPQGATINSASIQFTAHASAPGEGSPTINIAAEDIDDAPVILFENSNLLNRTKTTASVQWNPPAWTADDSGPDQQTPDLASVVQEVVDRAGWASGNAMMFLIDGPSDEGNYRRADAHDAGAADAATLTIEYVE